MDIKSIFADGVPAELHKLQFGQVVIFSSPTEGMIEKNIRISQYISSVAKHLKKNCGIIVHVPAVFVVPTENSPLHNCIVCKVATHHLPIIELSDLGSLTEMLYDYWGLDFDRVLKPVVLKRYLDFHFSIAEYHPIRICIAPIKVDSSKSEVSVEKFESGTMSLDYIYAKGKEPTIIDISKKIQKILWEADMYDVDIDYKKIWKEFEEQKKKSYSLDIDIDLKDNKCDINLVDENGGKHTIKLEPQEKAVYLAFMLFNHGEGMKLVDFDPINKEEKAIRKEFQALLDKIHLKMFRKNETKGSLQKKDVSEIRCRIRNKISRITMNQKYVQSFSIEGEKSGLYRIEASTEELRKTIKEKLGLQ